MIHTCKYDCSDRQRASIPYIVGGLSPAHQVFALSTELVASVLTTISTRTFEVSHFTPFSVQWPPLFRESHPEPAVLKTAGLPIRS